MMVALQRAWSLQPFFDVATRAATVRRLTIARSPERRRAHVAPQAMSLTVAQLPLAQHAKRFHRLAVLKRYGNSHTSCQYSSRTRLRRRRLTAEALGGVGATTANVSRDLGIRTARPGAVHYA